MKRHEWSKEYPRGSWPLYVCSACGVNRAPTVEEMQSDVPPAWFDSECNLPPPLTSDDIQWLLGTGRYGQ